MMKAILIAAALVLCCGIVSADVKISEVLYDPMGTESGGEAVELHNFGTSAVNISGWVIKTESSAADATVPEGVVLEAGEYYLIADAGFSTAKDDPSWPDADHEEAITFTNTNAGVALLDSSLNAIDAVGWGDPASIDAGLFEGIPTANVAEGNSIIRNDDTNNNLNDFQESAPDLRNRNSESGSGGSGNFSAKIAFSVTVSNPLSRIVSFLVADEDITKNGTQILPVPKMSKDVDVSVVVSNDNGHEDIGEVLMSFKGADILLNKSSVVNSTDAVYSGVLNFEFFDDAGSYDVDILLLNNTENGAGNFSVEYESLIAFEMDSNTLECDVKVGKSCVVSGDLNMSTANRTTLRNIGNIALDFELFGDDLIDGANVIDVSNVKYYFGGYGVKDLTKTAVLNSLHFDKGADAYVDLNFELNVPTGSKAGNYFTEIKINGVES